MSVQKNQLEGVLLIDKPSGCTSHDVVAHVRRKLKMKRIGHAGTLDPLATGLMIILVGKATKASQYLIGLDKEYEATMKLGQETDSHDSDGAVTETFPIPELTEALINEQLKTFLGEQLQTPPMFSAKKVNGVPLYKMARKGKVIEREPQSIHVYSFALMSHTQETIEFRLKCSKGTYVRTIAHDLARKLGSGGHLIQLRRTLIHDFNVTNVLSLDKMNEMDISEIDDCLIPVPK